MLGIETKLLTAFHPQTDEQTKQINQELEQYFRFSIDHRQKNWPEQLALAEFAVNNKIHSATKVSLFMANYGRKLRMEVNIRKKEKIEKAIEFTKGMKKIQKEVGMVLRKVQEKMKQQIDRRRMEVKG